MPDNYESTKPVELKPLRSVGGGLIKLFYLGMGIKRWFLVSALGIAVCSIGLAYLLRKLFEFRFPNFLPLYYEGVFFILVGLFMILFAVYGLYRSVGRLLLSTSNINSMADTIYARRFRARGPRVVVIGGGTGLSVLLRGLKDYTDNLSAIVAVGDDGGSSGRLRRELGVLPPGDFRNCLVAMSDAEPLVTRLFQYRFNEGDGLQGHSFGNLFIAAMTNVTGSFEKAIYESSKVLAVHGHILPVTITNLSISARMIDGAFVHGESLIRSHKGLIDRILIDPEDARAYPPVLKAIREADAIVIGPGSLYTSILPNLLVSGIVDEIHAASAIKVYVCNVATEKGETDGYAVADHVEALQRHTSSTIVDYVLADVTSRTLGPKFAGESVIEGDRPIQYAKLVTADITDRGHAVRHDSASLARAVFDIYDSRRKKKFSVFGSVKIT